MKSEARWASLALDLGMHLSVVPKLGSGDRELVVALQLTEEARKELDVAYFRLLEEPERRFEAFKVEQRQVSESTTCSERIVASLQDVQKLGARLEEEQSVWEATEDTRSTFGQRLVPVDARIVGVWEGITSQELGGYHQSIDFKHDLVTAEVQLMGRSLPASVRMNCASEPFQLDLEVHCGATPHVIPYIFKLQGDELLLCGPEGPAMPRASSFHGPGLCRMRRQQAMAMPQPEPESSPVAKGKAYPSWLAMSLFATATLLAARKLA